MNMQIASQFVEQFITYDVNKITNSKKIPEIKTKCSAGHAKEKV